MHNALSAFPFLSLLSPAMFFHRLVSRISSCRSSSNLFFKRRLKSVPYVTDASGKCVTLNAITHDFNRESWQYKSLIMHKK